MARIATILTLLLAGLVATPAWAADTVTVKDPSGGAKWTAKQTVPGKDRICVSVRRGKVSKGRSCSVLSGRLAFSYDQRVENASNPRAVRTVLVVSLAPDVVSARLSTPDGSRTYRRRSGRPRILIAVLAGRIDRPLLRVQVSRGGRIQTIEQGPEPAVQVADPFGGAAWRSRTVAGSSGVCVGWERVPQRYAPPPAAARGEARCGSAGADLPVAAAELVDGRLVVVGRAGAAVRSAVLRGPEGDRPLALESSTRALLAVLPGGTDPATLKVVGRLGDGREVERALDVVR